MCVLSSFRKKFVMLGLEMPYPTHREVLEQIQKLEQFINDWKMIPATGALRNQVLLALLSKALTVSRATCVLVESDFPAEAFGPSRTLIDIFFSVRYISNNQTEARATTFVEYRDKVRKEFLDVHNKFFPNKHMDAASALGPEAVQIAGKFKSRGHWTAHGGQAKLMALEPDENEKDELGEPLTGAVDYDAFYFWTSRFVHGTIKALDAHGITPGDVFSVRCNPERDSGYCRLALFNVLVYLNKTFIHACRAMREEQPDSILQDLFTLMKRCERQSGAA
jgi:hypothetical protein